MKIRFSTYSFVKRLNSLSLKRRESLSALLLLGLDISCSPLVPAGVPKGILHPGHCQIGSGSICLVLGNQRFVILFIDLLHILSFGNGKNEEAPLGRNSQRADGARTAGRTIGLCPSHRLLLFCFPWSLISQEMTPKPALFPSSYLIWCFLVGISKVLWRIKGFFSAKWPEGGHNKRTDPSWTCTLAQPLGICLGSPALRNPSTPGLQPTLGNSLPFRPGLPFLPPPTSTLSCSATNSQNHGCSCKSSRVT